MAFEPDHIFFCASDGGEEANGVAAFGLTEGTPSLHPGQGTPCRRFFFANCYLELLWVRHVREADLRPRHCYPSKSRNSNKIFCANAARRLLAFGCGSAWLCRAVSSPLSVVSRYEEGLAKQNHRSVTRNP